MTRPRVWLVGYVAAVWGVTAAASLGLLSPSTLAASPQRLADGRFWLLVTSGLVVDHPVVLSLLSLLAFAAVTGLLCGPAVALRAAVFGHVLSTLLVYGVIAVMRVGQPFAFGSALRRADFGVSAVCAAWLGAAAAVLWLGRLRAPAGRAAILVGCLLVAGLAYSLHPDRSIIASEHVFAFGIGILVGAPRWRRRLVAGLRRGIVRPWLEAGLDPGLGMIVATAGVVVAIAVAPTAFATIDSLVADRPASVARCLSSWNLSWHAPRARVARAAPAYAVVRTVSGVGDGRVPRDCALTFYGGRQTLVVRGLWRHGRVGAWRVRQVARPPVPPANAAVAAADGVRLVRVPVGVHRAGT
jgi:hypothetical protein